MARVVHFNLFIDKNRTDGGFAGTSWGWTDATANPPIWQPLDTANTTEADSAMLQPGDLVRVAIGERLTDGSTTTVSSITLAVVFGSRQVPNQINSPFFMGTQAKCLYLGRIGESATDLGTTGDTALTPWWGPGNNNGGYFAWVMELGNVADDPAATDHFELMIGANVRFNDGTVRSYGHDPEVDVGMGT